MPRERTTDRVLTGAEEGEWLSTPPTPKMTHPILGVMVAQLVNYSWASMRVSPTGTQRGW